MPGQRIRDAVTNGAARASHADVHSPGFFTLTDKPIAVPQPAATVLLLREGVAGLEVFMVVRHHQIDFASGALVFPGGRVDPGDHEIAADRALYPGDAPVPGPAPSLLVAAIRETFEECGVLLARDRGEPGLVAASRLADIERRHRAPMTAGTVSFGDILVQERLVLAPDALVHFAHWITPERVPKRFDTHFFLAHAPADQIALHDGQEAVESIWIAPPAAIAGMAAGTYKLVFPTEMNLRKLGRSATPAQAIEAARASPVVTVLPVVERRGEGSRVLRLPAEAGYGGELFEAANPPSMPS